MSPSNSSNAKKRPKLFRALGNAVPPDSVTVNRRTWQLAKVIKHDSWAATALYQSTDRGSADKKIVCKFNRLQPIGIVPMGWLGRRLARRESDMYRTLADVAGISTGYDHVFAGGQLQPHACAHDYIEGHPLRWHDNVDDQFFDKLDALLLELHRRDIAYVDMNKSENVIVDEQGNPNLIDFQISVRWPGPLRRGLLRVLQKSDMYHSFKIKRRFRPDLVRGTGEEKKRRPWWISVHRTVATPFRRARRKLLVALGIRKDTGKPHTESFIEEALRSGVGDSTAGTDRDPILSLYQLLRRKDYVERFDTGAAYIDRMVADLFDGKPLLQADKKLVRRIQRYSDHDKVVELLKSRTFFVRTERWSAELIRQRIESIRDSIATIPEVFDASDRRAA